MYPSSRPSRKENIGLSETLSRIARTIYVYEAINVAHSDACRDFPIHKGSQTEDP